MSAIHTPFLGGTGYGGMPDSGFDSVLAPPYAPGAQSPTVGEQAVSEEEGTEAALETGFTATDATAPEREVSEDQAGDLVAEWAQDIIEETERDEAAMGPTSDFDTPAPTQASEAGEEPVDHVETDTAEPEAGEAAESTESGFPDFLFGGDREPERKPETSPSPASQLDPETRERIRALAQELEGEDPPEDVITRAFEEGYRKAREEEA